MRGRNGAMARGGILIVVLAWLLVGCGVVGPSLSAGATGEVASTEGAGATSSDDPTLTDAEAALVALLRFDARLGCAPLADELPKGATVAVECLLDTDLVDRIDVYAFKTERNAAVAYLRALKAAGIKPRSGNCETGKGGDGAWAPGDDPRDVTSKDGVEFEGRLYIPARYGCFVQDGVAHAIATCGVHLVEVVAQAKPLEPLHTWVWDDAGNTGLKEPIPPGICTGG